MENRRPRTSCARYAPSGFLEAREAIHARAMRFSFMRVSSSPQAIQGWVVLNPWPLLGSAQYNKPSTVAIVDIRSRVMADGWCQTHRSYMPAKC